MLKSTFSKNRHGRFRDGDTFRYLFESVLADAQRQRGLPGDQPIDWCSREEASRPVCEYLDALEETNDKPAPPKCISLTDPAASWTATGGPAFYAYSTNYLIDLDAGIIVDVEPSSVV